MRSIELFAGCGGLALGLANAGFQHEFVVESDSAACRTLRLNKQSGTKHFRTWSIREADVRELSYAEFEGSIDLVSGGPPCQPFSIGGAHGGPTDPRNMWPEVIRAVREVRPRVFLFENVRGLLRPAFRDYVEFLRLQLAWPEIPHDDVSWQQQLVRLRKQEGSPTFHVTVQRVDTADYGAPQRRHRVIVLGVRSDVSSEIPFPAPTHSREALLWSQYIERTYWPRHGFSSRTRRSPISISDKRTVERLRGSPKPVKLPWITVRDAIGDLPSPGRNREDIANHVLHPGARVYPKHTGCRWDRPSKAIKAGSHGVPGGENVLVLRSDRVRYFTLREMARLQGFPDQFVVEPGWMKPIRQLGNAVPVQLGEAFGKSLKKLLHPT